MTLLLSGLALVFAAVMGLELSRITRDDDAVIPSQTRTPRPADQPAASLARLPDQQQWAAAVLARPLLARNRRPATVAVAPGSVAAPPGMPRLSGVLIDGGNRRAIFAGPAGGKAVTATEGGEVAGFRVQRIEAGQVTLLGPDGPRLLRPSFGPQSAETVPPPPAVIGLPSLDSLRNLSGLPDPASEAPR